MTYGTFGEMDENLEVDDGFRREDGYIWVLNRTERVVGRGSPIRASSFFSRAKA